MAYFDDVLTTIGITIKVGSTTVQGAYNYSDIGAEPNDLDATPLSATHAVKKPGLIDDAKWELDYYYNETDFTALETIRTGGSSTTIEVTLPNGAKYANTGILGANILTGGTVGAMQQTKAVFTLGNANGWTKTNPS